LSYDEESSGKMNALDLVINVLKDHEKRLDELLWKLEAIIETRGVEAKEKKFKGSEEPSPLEMHMTLCKGWREFKERSIGAKQAAFKVEEKTLTIDSLTNGEGYRYVENLRMPIDRVSLHIKGCEEDINNVENIVGVFKKRLKCGLQASIKSLKFRSPEGEEILVLIYDIDPETVKSWLSKELRIPEGDIKTGKIIF
jgi:hypothetical protein